MTAPLAALPDGVALLGFAAEDLPQWLRFAVDGFSIGPFRVSIIRILAALVLFVAILAATRLVQRALSRSVLAPPRMDAGIAHSITTGVGYAGWVVAALTALSVGGLDITNLAIVAGALSVGIGFGLQSIVNNFVSGLILLVERPVKVGDWISVKGHEGHVRRIAVRATEIETSDKSSVIIPNAELITNSLVNHTHRGTHGRAVVKVGVIATSDPDAVTQALIEAAGAVAHVRPEPPPSVAFDDIGRDAFEFSLAVTLADVNKAGEARTALRAAIVRAFRARGIEFARGQRDIHLRDLDAVKVLVARVAEQRAREAAAEALKAAVVDPGPGGKAN